MSHNSKASVSLIRCPDYSDDERVYASLKRLLEKLGGIERFVKPREKVLIKPNLLAGDSPERAVTTHPSVVAGVVRLVKEAGGIPRIGDSPCIARFESVVVPTGVEDVARRYGAQLVDLCTPAHVVLENGVILKKAVVAKEALDADAVISISKLKTHNYAIFTGAVKNMFGVVPGLLKSDYHLRMPGIEDFSKMLLDIYTAVPARLHVMDGIMAMEGQKGPRAGRPKAVGVLIASEDGIAVDAVATHLVGIEPLSVPTTSIGRLAGIGVGKIEEIEVLGESIEEVKVTGFEGVRQPGGIAQKLPSFLFRLLRNHVSNRPRINIKDCELCLTCVKACPPQAIYRQRDGTLRIDYDKCIRCFCCLESCPYDAVAIKEGLLAKLSRR